MPREKPSSFTKMTEQEMDSLKTAMSSRVTADDKEWVSMRRRGIVPDIRLLIAKIKDWLSATRSTDKE